LAAAGIIRKFPGQRRTRAARKRPTGSRPACQVGSGGVFGIAILAAVFAVHGSYDGFRPAEWVAAAVAAVGVPIAALAPAKFAH
jgi:hypothetical protein